MTHRMTVSLSDSRYEQLSRIATRQGRNATNLATFLLENAIENLLKEWPEPQTIQGVIQACLETPDKPWSKQADRLGTFSESVDLEKFEVDMILQGRRPTDGQILAIATAANMSVRDLDILVKQQYGNSKSN